MNVYKKTKSTITFEFRYDKFIIETLKLLFNGIKYKPTDKSWVCPNNQFNVDRLQTMEKMYNFSEFDEVAVFDEDSLKDICIISDKEVELVRKAYEESDLKRKPWDYQIFGATFMLATKSCLNGDDMGLGKTGQAIIAIELGNLFPALIITPSTVKYNWEKEWCKWIDGRDISVIDGDNQNFDADVVIINYDIIKKHNIKLRKEWGAVVLDESQYVKNGKSQRSKVAYNLTKKTENRFLLTGTPIMNKPEELIYQLKIMRIFEDFGGWKKFIFRYCDAHYGAFGLDSSGASNTLELNKKLRESCYISREKSDVKGDMPDRNDQIFLIPFNKKRDFNSASLDIVGYTLKKHGREAADRAEMAPDLVMSSTLKGISIDGKIKGIKDWINDFKSSTNDKLLVFGRRTSQLNELSDYFNSPLIDGSVNSKKKFDMVQEFISSDDQILFGNIQSLGTGTDGLQEVCSHVVFIELPDRPTDLEQAIARVHRSGQKKSVNVYYLFGTQCIDDIMWEVIQEKYSIVDAVNKGKDRKSTIKKLSSMDKEIYKRIKNGNDGI